MNGDTEDARHANARDTHALGLRWEDQDTGVYSPEDVRAEYLARLYPSAKSRSLESAANTRDGPVPAERESTD
jgi:hypothetical protein